jgi:hypothetical protein
MSAQEECTDARPVEQPHWSLSALGSDQSLKSDFVTALLAVHLAQNPSTGALPEKIPRAVLVFASTYTLPIGG